MKYFNKKIIVTLKRIFNRKDNLVEPCHLFEVRIYTSHYSTYLVKYIHCGKSVIEETLTGCWKKVIQVPKSELLNFQVYITNPTGNKQLKCQIDVNELIEENSAINTTKFSFPVGSTLETWEWKLFEVKSILN